jgi:NADH-quinone oxidoreductase subunit N
MFMNLGLFAALILISNQNQSDDIPTFAGLVHISMPLALVVVVFLASLAGLPPMGGFIGKFTIFAAVMKKPELLWLGVIAVLNSVVSLYYYFRIAQQMFFRDAANTTQKLKFSPALLSSLVVTSVVTLVAGVFPNCLLTWIKNIVGS